MYQIELNGRFLFHSPNINLVNEIKSRYFPTAQITLNRQVLETITEFINPPSTIGSSVLVSNLSPFVEGGNSYQFSSSVNSFIEFPASDDWVLGTEDFTIEWFGYQTNTSQFQRVFSIGDFPTITVGVSIETSTFYYWANNAFRYSSSGSTSINTWYHWAVVRRNNETSIYRNGQIRGSSIVDNNNIINNSTKLSLGNTTTPATNAAFVGNITNFRWVKGLAVYTGDFTVPTSKLTVTSPENPYGGSNTQAIGDGFTKLLIVP